MNNGVAAGTCNTACDCPCSRLSSSRAVGGAAVSAQPGLLQSRALRHAEIQARCRAAPVGADQVTPGRGVVALDHSCQVQLFAECAAFTAKTVLTRAADYTASKRRVGVRDAHGQACLEERARARS